MTSGSSTSIRWRTLKRYPDRFVLLHSKDLAPSAPTGTTTGQTSPEHSVTLGTGQVDLAAVLAALPETAVRHVFIEDESSDALGKQLPASLRTVRDAYGSAR